VLRSFYSRLLKRMCTQGSIPTGWMYMCTNDKKVRQLDTGLKAASVNCYRSHVVLHIRKYFGESYKKFHSNCGVPLSRQEFEHLLALQYDILADFDHQRFVSTLIDAAVDFSPSTSESNKKNILSIPLIDPQPNDSAVCYLQPLFQTNQLHRKRLKFDFSE
jgi:hypothetical protein